MCESVQASVGKNIFIQNLIAKSLRSVYEYVKRVFECH